MDFFELPTPPDDLDDDYDDSTAPYLAKVLPYARLVAKTDEIAILLTRVVAFPDGFEMQISRFTRGSVRRKLQNSFGHPHQIMRDGVVPDDYFRAGVGFSDGRKATNLEMPWTRPTGDEAPDCGIDNQGGGGNGANYNDSFFVWPLPPEGDLRVVVEWPAFGLDQTQIVLDASEIRRAGESVQPVWAEDAGKPSHYRYVPEVEDDADV